MAAVKQKVDFEIAIRNLTDILIDDFKFDDFKKSMYGAIDTDNEGFLYAKETEVFVKDFLRGKKIPGEEDTDFEPQHEGSFDYLRECENGEVTVDDLAKFLRILLQN